MEKQYKNILVAGGSGFLGKHVVEKLKERNLPFASLDLVDGYDFRDLQKTKELFNTYQFDAVINCAAFIGGIEFHRLYEGEIFYNNIVMTTNLMEAARLAGVKRFVNPLSNCAYPDGLSIFKEEDFWSGQIHENSLTYGFIKKAGLIQGMAYQKQYGFDSVHLILPNMYGPGDKLDEVKSHALGALVAKFLTAKENNLPEVVVWGTGKPIREWLYVGDGAEALVRGLFIESHVDPINIGIGKGISIKELAEIIQKEVGYEGKMVFDTTRPDGTAIKIMDVARMQKIFNWSPQTDFKEGIKKTIDWYKKSKKK